MKRRIKTNCTWLLLVSFLMSALLTGCQPMQPFYLNEDGDLSHYLDTATDIEYTDVCQEPLEEVTQSRAPRTVTNPQFSDFEFWDLTLEDAMSYALHNSKVIRSFGSVRNFGQLVGAPPERLSAAPDSVATVYDPAIQETSQSGVEQVLSNFDAIFNSSVNWDNSDRPQNFVGGNSVNSPDFQQDRVQILNEVSKRSAQGTQWFFRNDSIYTGSNNALTANTRQLPSDWYTAFEFEARQPFLRNRGTQVNRIPIVLARIRTDLSLIDFENSVMELVNTVEFSYWELYFFYHNLSAAKTGRDSAQAAWQKVHALYENGEPGGEAEKEAQAKEQYFFFRDRVEQAQRDLFKSENRLRYLMGLTPTDHRLIRPSDRPTTARVAYVSEDGHGWSDLLGEALSRSSSIRRQGWRIKQREMELIAARNQLLPRLDMVALYRVLGVGDVFNTARSIPPDFPNEGSSAVDQLFDNDNSEFRLGLELEVPLGFRRELTQVRNSEMSLARERAKLQDMELEITHQMTDAVQELDSGYRSLLTNYSRRAASHQQVAAVEAAYLAGTTSLDLLLEAQRRQSDSNIAYYQALVSYNLALSKIHLRKGSLLEYNGVMLAEGPWPKKAYFDAANRARRRDASHYLDYGFSRPNVISRGAIADRNVNAVQPATFGDDPYAGIEFETTSDANSDSGNENEPTPAGKDGKDGSLSDSLDNAIDSMTDGEGKGRTRKKKSELPDIPEPSRATPRRAPQDAGELPAPNASPGSDDLEAGRPRRTAQRAAPRATQRSTSITIRQPKIVRPSGSNRTATIRWKD